MRVMVACEFSGVVREAFRRRGHDAWSCDLLPTEIPGQHIQGDVRDVDLSRFDLMVAHPPCTHLAVSGARWFSLKHDEQQEALDLVRYLLGAPVFRKCVENPVSVISSRVRPPEQIIHPWQFGHATDKTTCLWLEWLPPLVPTAVVRPEYVCSASGRRYNDWHLHSGQGDGQERSRTFSGIAEAMAEQWGSLEG